MEEDIQIQPGYCFRPTEEELLFLLWQKATNQKLATEEVKEKVLYGKDADPWRVFGDDDRWQILEENKGMKKMVYVFTKLTKLSPKKVARTAGSGTWDGETTKTNVVDCEGQIMGTRKMLSYVLNVDSTIKGGWIMHEYSLDSAYLNGIENRDYVLCRIIKDESKYTKVKVSPKTRKRKVPEDVEVQEPACGGVSGKRRPNFEKEYSRDHMTRDNREIVNAVSSMTTEEGGAMELPNWDNDEKGTICPHGMVNDLGMEGETYTSLLLAEDDCMLQPILCSSYNLQQDAGLIQQEVPSTYIDGTAWIPPTMEGISCQDIEQTSTDQPAATNTMDVGIADASVNGWDVDGCGRIDHNCMVQPDACENLPEDTTSKILDNEKLLIHDQSAEQNAPDLIDLDGDSMICQLEEINDFLDSIFSKEFLASLDQLGADQLHGPLKVTDEWFQDTLERWWFQDPPEC